MSTNNNNNNNNSGVNQDPMVVFKRVTVKAKDTPDGQYIKLWLNPEQAGVLIDAITAALEISPERGASLDLHITKKNTQDGSRSFLSAISFVKGTPEPPTDFSASSAPKSTPAPARSPGGYSNNKKPVSTATDRVSRLKQGAQ